jgi:hypothetical protein
MSRVCEMPIAAAAIPATCVPWLVSVVPLGSGDGSESLCTKSQPFASRFAARSAIVKSTPVSTTAIVWPAPVVVSQAGVK